MVEILSTFLLDLIIRVIKNKVIGFKKKTISLSTEITIIVCIVIRLSVFESYCLFICKSARRACILSLGCWDGDMTIASPFDNQINKLRSRFL